MPRQTSNLVAFVLNLWSSSEEQNEAEEATQGYGSMWPEQKRRIDLESSTWETLPPDLLFDRILVRLSFPCLLRFRCVSRLWRSRLSSSTFWHCWLRHEPDPNSVKASQPVLHAISKSRQAGMLLSALEASSDEQAAILESVLRSASPGVRCIPRYLLISAMPSAALQPAALRWMKKKSVRFSRKPANARHCHLLRSWDSFLQMPEPYTILCSDKGILLILQHDLDSKSEQLVVCNPLLRKWKFLPTPRGRLVVPAIHFFVDPESGDYVVFLDDLQFYISNLGKWQAIPRTLCSDEMSKLPPLLDGSVFCISQKERIANNDVAFGVYHAGQRIVTKVHTCFPCKVFFPRRGLVWRDAQGLQTLAAAPDWFGVWKLDERLWRKLKKLPLVIQDGFEFHASKICNLLVLTCRCLWQNNFYVFDLECDEGALMSAGGPLTEVVGHWPYQPSCYDV